MAKQKPEYRLNMTLTFDTFNREQAMYIAKLVNKVRKRASVLKLTGASSMGQSITFIGKPAKK